MALVLSLKEYEIFHIDEASFVVEDIGCDHFFVKNLLTNDRSKVVATRQIIIQPEVKVSAGEFNKANTVKLVIEAPRHIIIERQGYKDANRN